jgi:hypothetical protein
VNRWWVPLVTAAIGGFFGYVVGASGSDDRRPTPPQVHEPAPPPVDLKIVGVRPFNGDSGCQLTAELGSSTTRAFKLFVRRASDGAVIDSTIGAVGTKGTLVDLLLWRASCDDIRERRVNLVFQ